MLEMEFVKSSFVLSRAAKVFTYFSPLTVILVSAFLGAMFVYNRRRSRLVKMIEKIPGPASMPIIGNSLHINVDHDEIFNRIISIRKLYGRQQGFSRAWNGPMPYVMISKAAAVEPILSSPKHIEKSHDYEFLKPWLGTGLLTSQGRKWHPRRKILTPAFHFKILDDFVDIFQEQSAVLVQRLERELGNREGFNCFPYVTLCALDIVCETAMGRLVNAQMNSDSEYVKAVYQIGGIVQNRQQKIWLQPDFIFKRTKDYRDHQRCLSILHEFSNRVIHERKEEIRKQKLSNNNSVEQAPNADGNNNAEEFGRKKRLAFLDLLIEASQDGTVLSHEDIREEVDTFMFEGHDTTSAAISWILLLLGAEPAIQDRIVEEIDEIMGGDRDRFPTMKELNDMKYLECCIKEGLRLYPSVPLIARKLVEDCVVQDYTIPAGTTAMIVVYQLHRDPAVFPNPDKFNPDHFAPENCRGRHPYAYIPFSAGPRNCIGQKFAVLEEKSIISAVLRKYRIEAVDRRENLTLLGELILRPKDGLRIKISRRV
ncbi:cytochrome P450 [Culex quinquefasciatus]|uniref:Cytochrome P450 n=1 Tax=Culex quinquefasciatus TaxID=7176 RepID=B0XI56_CULQU|nr:cytochrome P450 [Culex quinquefasciatus]|eukprot:XP_001869328.1 cytochrome P450 [Culex quinquefasciatus]